MTTNTSLFLAVVLLHPGTRLKDNEFLTSTGVEIGTIVRPHFSQSALDLLRSHKDKPCLLVVEYDLDFKEERTGFCVIKEAHKINPGLPCILVSEAHEIHNNTGIIRYFEKHPGCLFDSAYGESFPRKLENLLSDRR